MPPMNLAVIWIDNEIAMGIRMPRMMIDNTMLGLEGVFTLPSTQERLQADHRQRPKNDEENDPPVEEASRCSKLRALGN